MKLGTAYIEHIRQRPDYFVVEVHEDSNWRSRGAFDDIPAAYECIGRLRKQGVTQPIRILQRTTRDRLVSVDNQETRAREDLDACFTREQVRPLVSCIHTIGHSNHNLECPECPVCRSVHAALTYATTIGLVEGGEK